MGYAAVALLAATGAINTLLLVGNVDSLAGTPYGRLLSLKILLFPVMVVLALINRFRLLPRLRREPPSSAPIAALARSVLFEQALGFAVLAVVSVFGTWPPAIHHHRGSIAASPRSGGLLRLFPLRTRSPDRGRRADAAPTSDGRTALGTPHSMPV